MQKMIYLEKPKSGRVEAAAGTAAVESSAGTAGVAAPPDEEARIDDAVRWINNKVAYTVHFGLLQIGYYLLTNFFDGSVEAALSRNPNKAQSFRKLCQRPDLVISATHLVNSVKLVSQERALEGDATFAALPVSHKIALLPLQNLELKRTLAHRTAAEGLSVRALNKEVRAVRVKKGLPQQAWSRRMRRALDGVRRELGSDESSNLGELGYREAETLRETLQQVRRELDDVLSRLPSQVRRVS